MIVSTHLNTLQHTATHLQKSRETNVKLLLWADPYSRLHFCEFIEARLQHIATRCNTLQHAAKHGDTLHTPATHDSFTYGRDLLSLLQHTCNMYTATHLQHTTIHCNTPQHTATH